MLLYYLAPLQNDTIVMSRCVQLSFGDKGEVYLLDESVLPVTEKEGRREGTRSIGSRIYKTGVQPVLSTCGTTPFGFL